MKSRKIANFAFYSLFTGAIAAGAAHQINRSDAFSSLKTPGVSRLYSTRDDINRYCQMQNMAYNPAELRKCETALRSRRKIVRNPDYKDAVEGEKALVKSGVGETFYRNWMAGLAIGAAFLGLGLAATKRIDYGMTNNNLG